MTTLLDIARATGLARTTVGEVLRGKPGYSDATRAQVDEAARRLNYERRYASEVLATGRTSTVGVVLGAIADDLASFGFADVLGGLTRILHRHGYHVSLLPIEAEEEFDLKIIKLIRAGRVDAFFFARGLLGKKTLKELVHQRIPAVTIDEDLGESSEGVVSVVRRDNRSGMMTLARSMADARCHRVVYVRREPDRSPLLSKRREREYLSLLTSALAEHGIALDEKRDVLQIENQKEPYLSESSRMRRFAATHLSRLVDTDLILCRDDAMAFSVDEALREQGVVPGRDVALVGHGNIESAARFRNQASFLTTIDPGNEQVGCEAAELILRHLKDPEVSPQVTVVPSRLVVRETFCPDVFVGKSGRGG